MLLLTTLPKHGASAEHWVREAGHDFLFIRVCAEDVQIRADSWFYGDRANPAVGPRQKNSFIEQRRLPMSIDLSVNRQQVAGAVRNGA